MSSFFVLTADEDIIDLHHVEAVNGLEAAKQFREEMGLIRETDVFVVRASNLQRIRLVPPEMPRWKAFNLKL